MRDFISDLIRQDTVAAVQDGTFFVGSIFSHKLASTAETYGATLIKQDRLLLGTSLRSAAPVLRRLTSAYVLSHLISSIEKYSSNKNDTASLVNIGVDSAFLAIDTAETSIEVMELLGVQAVEGLSAITGPIGMAVGAVLILGSNMYETVKKMEAINKEISLSSNQEITETLRAFFHVNPSEEVQNEMDEYEANELIATQIKAQLNNQREFKYYITSSGRIKSGKLQMMNDTIIDLQGKVTFVKSKANPKNVEIFCPLSVSLNEHKKGIHEEKSFWKKLGSFFTDLYWDVKTMVDVAMNNFKSVALDVAQINSEDLGNGYVCHNAFGIMNQDAKSESAFYQLGSGYDRVHGLLNSVNVFNISNGQKVVYGGNADDTFILFGKNISGLLDGTGGVDTLDLSKFNLISELHMVDTRVTCGSSSFIAMNINSMVGRQNIKDVIDCSCDLTAVDSRGGQDSSGSDILSFKNMTCSYNITVILSSYTELYTDKISGIFRHIVKPDAHHIFISTSGAAMHSITFNVPLTLISDWNYLNNTFIFSSNNVQILTLAGQVENFNISFKDGIQMKIKSGHIVTLLKTDHSVTEIIEIYDGFLQSKNLSMIAYSTTDRQSIIFNHGKYSLQKENNQSILLNVVYNDVQNENHIVCALGENVVLIRRAANSKFTIPDVYIHCEFGELVLDFSKISSTVCEHWPGCEVKVSGGIDHTGKLITLHLRILSDKNSTKIGTVFINIESMSKISIVNYGTSRIIAKMPREETEDQFSYYQFNDTNGFVNFYPINSSNAHLSNLEIHSLIIVPDSIRTDANTSFMYFTKCDLEYYQTVHVAREILNFGVYKINESIMVTNLEEKMIWDHQNLFTIILEDYYVNEKLKTIRFIDSGGNVFNFDTPTTIIRSLEDFWRRLVANDDFFYGY
uniref:Uncharacterized protein n=1 Tax=Romanomermis culicivorax TaxID=13658 RepID=A0A915HIF2_ROMCU